MSILSISRICFKWTFLNGVMCWCFTVIFFNQRENNFPSLNNSDICWWKTDTDFSLVMICIFLIFNKSNDETKKKQKQKQNDLFFFCATDLPHKNLLKNTSVSHTCLFISMHGHCLAYFESVPHAPSYCRNYSGEC